MNLLSINFCHYISSLDSWLICWRIIFHLWNLWNINSWHSDHDQWKYKCQNKIKEWSTKNNCHPCPDRFIIKCILTWTFFIFPHHTCPAKRQQLYRIKCIANLFPYDRWSKSNTKFIYLNSIFLCNQKMSKFVYNDNNSKN